MTTHPTAIELVAYLDGQSTETISRHIAQCAECQTLTAVAGPQAPVPSAKARWAPVTVATPTAETRVPKVQDVWRVVWNDIHQLAVVIGESDDQIRVLAVLDDIDDADESTVRLRSQQSGTGFDLGVYAAQLFSLPLFVFDACIGVIDESAAAELSRAVDACEREQPLAAPAGKPVDTLSDNRINAIGRVVNSFEKLSKAQWWDGAASAPIDWGELMGRDIVSPQRALQLKRGAPPSAEELKLAGTDTSTYLPALDRTLVAYLDHPRQSTQLRKLARERALPEQDERLRAAKRIAERRSTVAARSDAEFDWGALFEEYIHERRK